MDDRSRCTAELPAECERTKLDGVLHRCVLMVVWLFHLRTRAGALGEVVNREEMNTRRKREVLLVIK